MRLLFTICALFFAANVLLAQTEEGKIFIGAQSGLSYSSMDSELQTDSGDDDMGSTKESELSPQIGYFISDGLLIGAELPFSSSKQENDDDEYKMNTIALVPFARRCRIWLG